MKKFPQRIQSARTADTGVNLVAQIVNDTFGWIFRRYHQEDDFGLDGVIEIVDEYQNVTGRTIAVQIKYGSSYMAIHESAIRFKGKIAHLNYWGNSQAPVIILVGDPITKKIYWELFDTEKTDACGEESWEMDIPLKNEFNQDSKSKFLEIAGSAIDFADAAKKNWEINKLIKDNTGPILYIIHKEDIIKKNFEPLESFAKRLTHSRDMVMKARSKVWIVTVGYEFDDREIWEIKEVLDWLKTAFGIFKYWAWFVDLSQTRSGFGLLYLSQFSPKRTGSTNSKIITEFNKDAMGYFLNSIFCWLNELCDNFAINQDDNMAISNDVLNHMKKLSEPNRD